VSTATQETSTQKLPSKVRFASKSRHLTLIRVQSRTRVDAAGNKVFTDPVEYEFQEGFLDVFGGKDVIADKYDPESGEFAEQDCLEWLRSHPDFNRDGGFWEVAPVAPDPAQMLEHVMRLAVAAGNPELRAQAEDQLAEIHEREIATWKREPIIGACRSALQAIESQKRLSAPPTPEQLQRRERPAPPKPPSPSQIPQSGRGPAAGGDRPFNPDAAPPAAE
jgi:hypothetical protein